MLKKALKLANKTGWRLFPVGIVAQSGGKTNKRPLCKWKSEASNTPEGIKALWQRNAYAAIGVATGAENGLYVVDVDDPCAVERAGIDLGACAILMRTNRPGGMHYYFGPPEDGLPVRNSADDGLDVRGDGGFVVVWSKFPADKILWPLPESLAVWARTRSNSVAVETASVGELILEGARESTMVSMAGTLWRRGFVVDAVRAALWVQNSQRCVPPLEEEAIERIAASVTRYNRDELDVSTVRAALQAMK